jgi:hypothetical protein
MNRGSTVLNQNISAHQDPKWIKTVKEESIEEVF